MTTGELQPSMESTELRRQEMGFYEAIVAVLAVMPAAAPSQMQSLRRRASGLASSGDSSTAVKRR